MKAQKSRRFGGKLWQLRNCFTEDKRGAELDAKWMEKHEPVRAKVVEGHGLKRGRKYYVYTRPFKWDKE